MASSIILLAGGLLHMTTHRCPSHNNIPLLHRVSCFASVHGCIVPSSLRNRAKTCTQMEIGRRSGRYKPSMWTFEYIQSLTSEYVKDTHKMRVSELVAQVKLILDEDMENVQQLELIDILQKMGISYHFENEINRILDNIYVKKYYKNYHAEERELYTTALEFRLLRQHGFSISQDVFDSFKVEKGYFDPSLADDTRGLLQMYDASYLMAPGEESMEMAKEFAAGLLQKKLEDGNNGLDESLSLLVRNSIELPIHWRTQRPNARWFIDVYERSSGMNPMLFELAKLDFNIVQATHQQELKHVSKWWKDTRLTETLPFARDRLVECYFWTLGGLFQPQYGYSRVQATKVNALITVIDDIFDIYGTLEELQLFNHTIHRWDLDTIEKLPNYMKMCCLALNNFINEMAYDVLKEQGILIIRQLRKSWADLCRSYLQEAEWVARGYIPTTEEYINNAWISISAPVILSHAFFLVTKPIEDEAVAELYKYHDIVRCSAMILRLANDLGTSPFELVRGDVPKAMECYMNETRANRDEAKEFARFMVQETWKKMNQVTLMSSSPFDRNFIRSAADLRRMAMYMYQHGDGHGIQNPQIKQRISTLLFDPIL